MPREDGHERDEPAQQQLLQGRDRDREPTSHARGRWHKDDVRSLLCNVFQGGPGSVAAQP